MSPSNQEPFSPNSNWPDSHIERVEKCPVCGSESRELLHKGLTDRIFFCAPGKWTMYSCGTCKSAYLDPRPTLDSIGLAYRSYYTHQASSDYSSLSLVGKLRRSLANGYRNWRYGCAEVPANILGVAAMMLMPDSRAILDAGMRHLPRPKPGQRLLDVGCGNGAFLVQARSAGWDVLGLDFDAKAVQAALRLNLDVRVGGIECLNQDQYKFDIITLSHVIEHFYNPIETLESCYNLLSSNGFLWIETPNINSEGHRNYGDNWRGLEPPRHLVLFTLDSLKLALERSGFSRIEIQPYRPLCSKIFTASMAIASGIDPYCSEANLLTDTAKIKESEKLEKRLPESREFITLKAWK